jgi:Flp pilus assembly protein protease CpaA
MPPLIPLTLIIVTGLLTSVTDLTHKKIRNNHLLVVGAIYIALVIYFFLSQKTLPTLELLSGGIAVAIALFLYTQNLWKPGDGKLFIFFSFLMPSTGYENIFYFPSLQLFINAFLLGLLFILSDVIKGVCRSPKMVFLRMIAIKTRSHMIKTFFLSLCLSWMIFPLLHYLRLDRSGFLSFMIIYILLHLFYLFINFIPKNRYIYIFILTAGLLLRITLDPQFFSGLTPLIYLVTIFCYALLSHTLVDLTDRMILFKDRVPFSPFLFAGCLLSYTPFLAWFMHFFYKT